MRHAVTAGLWAWLLLGAPGCVPKRIPGTDIPDNSDTREILSVIERYRSALEHKDAEAILALVSDSFRDSGSSSSEALDYQGLKAKLPERLAKLEDVKVEISVRKIQIDENLANAIYYYTESFRIPRLTTKKYSEGDLKQMWFKRVPGGWKILSGI